MSNPRENIKTLIKHKTFNIDKNPKHDGYQRGLTSMVYKCFVKKASYTRANKFAGATTKKETKQNEQLTEELHKPIIRKWKVYSLFRGNIWGVDLAGNK